MNSTVNATTTPANTDLKDGGIPTTLILNAFVAGIAYILFLILRPRFPKVYWPRWINNSENARKWYLGFIAIPITERLKESEEQIGMYGTVLLDIEKWLLFFLCVVGGTCFVIFIVLHAISNDTDSFLTTTGSNLNNDSTYLWAHVAVGIVVSCLAYLFCFWLLRRFYAIKHRFRTLHSENANVEDHTAFIASGIEKNKYSDEGEISKYVDQLNLGKVVSTHVNINAPLVTELFAQKRQLEQDLDKFIDRSDTLGKPEMTRTGPLGLIGKKVVAVDYTRSNIEKVNTKLAKKQEKAKNKRELCGNAFVTFADTKGAAQFIYEGNSKQKKLEVWPNIGPPDEIFWENLGYSKFSKSIRSFFAMVLVVGLSFMWSLPIIFLSNLTNLTTFPTIGPVFEPVVTSIPGPILDFIQAYAPIVLLIAFFVFLPAIITALEGISKPYSYDQQEQGVLVKMWVFIIFNVLVFQTVVGAGYPVVLNLVNGSGFGILDSLKTVNWGGVGAFFTRYFITLWLQAAALELLNIGGVVGSIIKKRFIAKTEKERAVIDHTPPFRYSIAFASVSLWWAVALTYILVVPLVTVAAIFFLLIRRWLDKYEYMAIFPHDPDHDGRQVPACIATMILGIACFQLFMLAFFLTKELYEGTYIFIAMAGFTGFVWLFFIWVDKHYFQINDLKAAAEHPIESKVSQDQLENAYIHPVYWNPNQPAPSTHEDAVFTHAYRI